MFFQLQEICLQTSDAGIRETIDVFPKSPEGIDKRALLRLERARRADGPVLAKFTLCCVAGAKRSLLRYKNIEATSIRKCQEGLGPDQLVNDIDRLVSCCANLVMVDEEEDVVQFVHNSTKHS